MKTKYIVLNTTYVTDVKNTSVYGIGYAQFEGDKVILLESIVDVTNSLKSISELIALCNKLELDPIHLNDVVEDFI